VAYLGKDYRPTKYLNDLTVYRETKN